MNSQRRIVITAFRERVTVTSVDLEGEDPLRMETAESEETTELTPPGRKSLIRQVAFLLRESLKALDDDRSNAE